MNSQEKSEEIDTTPLQMFGKYISLFARDIENSSRMKAEKQFGEKEQKIKSTAQESTKEAVEKAVSEAVGAEKKKHEAEVGEIKKIISDIIND